MMRHFIRLCDVIARFSEYTVIIMFCVMVVSVFWQVVSRYFFYIPCPWSGDLATFMFIWIVMVGTALAIYREKHIAITELVALFSDLNKRRCRYLVDCIVLGCSIFLTVTSYDFFLNNIDIYSSGLVISLGWPASSMLVGAGLMTLFSLVNLLRTFHGGTEDSR